MFFFVVVPIERSSEFDVHGQLVGVVFLGFVVRFVRAFVLDFGLVTQIVVYPRSRLGSYYSRKTRFCG